MVALTVAGTAGSIGEGVPLGREAVQVLVQYVPGKYEWGLLKPEARPGRGSRDPLGRRCGCCTCQKSESEKAYYQKASAQSVQQEGNGKQTATSSMCLGSMSRSST